jgi:PAS domain S-box-containing protein
VPSPTGGEIGQLTRAFNDMLSGIEARDRELRQARDQAEHSAALQRRAAEQLREGEQRLHALFEGIHDALLVVDAVGRVLDCNDVACRVLGHSREALLGMHASGVVEDGDALSGIGGEGGPRVRESALLARDGRRVPVELSVGDIAYAGRPAVVAVARDLTERRDAEAQRQLLERQLQHAQKLESLGVLAGGIAHDFNNLLTAILGHVSLALARLPVGSEAASHLRLAESATAQAAQLTNQMLAYSGRGRFVVEPMDLSEVVQGIAHLLAASKAKGVALRHALGVGLPRIRGDVAQVRQVVMNLVTNAAESIGERPGTVLLRTWHEVLAAPRSIPLGAQQLAAGPYCVLEVTDEGCGMTADTLDRIFEPFFTTKARGRGLGLAAVLGIMKGHGGALEVWSRPQEGTRFRAWFPASQPETATVAPAPAAASATAAGRGVTLILADDEDAVRTLATRTLRERGHHVLEARDGAEAVELMDAHMPRVGAAVLDLTMPGLGGVETARALRARVPDLPLLFMSGYDDMGETSGIPGTGPCLFLRKPYAPAQLQNAVAELLSRAAPSQPRTDAS